MTFVASLCSRFQARPVQYSQQYEKFNFAYDSFFLGFASFSSLWHQSLFEFKRPMSNWVWNKLTAILDQFRLYDWVILLSGYFFGSFFNPSRARFLDIHSIEATWWIGYLVYLHFWFAAVTLSSLEEGIDSWILVAIQVVSVTVWYSLGMCLCC